MTTPPEPGPHPAALVEHVRELAMRTGRRAADRAGQWARRASAPARSLTVALRGEGQTQGLRHLPQEGPVIIAANRTRVPYARPRPRRARRSCT